MTLFGVSGARIGKFTVSGPDANGFVWLLCGLEPMERKGGGNVMGEKAVLKLSLELEKVSPNPANSYTKIFFTVDKRTFVSISIYDKNGRMIKELVKGIYEPGIYNISWGLVDEEGKRVNPGEYFVVFKGGENKRIRKLLIIK